MHYRMQVVVSHGAETHMQLRRACATSFVWASPTERAAAFQGLGIKERGVVVYSAFSKHVRVFHALDEHIWGT